MQRMQAIEAPIKNNWSFMLARTQLALMYFALLDLLRAYYARVGASIYYILDYDYKSYASLRANNWKRHSPSLFELAF